MTSKRDFASFDVYLCVLVLALSVFGAVVLSSAGGGIKMQIVWIVTGFVIMFVVAFVDYEFICRFYIPFYLLNLALLVAVIVIKRVTGKNVMREIGIGEASIMPSEFAKIFMIVFIAKYIDRFGKKINNFFVAVLLVILTVVPFALIYLQPSLSASTVLLFILVVMLFAGKLYYRYFLIALAVIIPAAAFLYYDINREEHLFINLIFEDYQIEERLKPFLDREAGDPDDLFQTDRSIAAISSGQLSGVGYGNNEVYVPESANDFIFSVIGSEFGFLGSIAAVILGFAIVFKCLLAAYKTEFMLGRLLCIGVASMFAFHIFVNVGVATGMLPNTGITFPFISSGGSSVWSSMACIGLVLNAGMKKSKSMFE
ncbi:rod shape-determining protein RodA [Clostridia bacterium]|nr:rod shape-determining protein RodA [Clostridia bacterium]